MSYSQWESYATIWVVFLFLLWLLLSVVASHAFIHTTVEFISECAGGHSFCLCWKSCHLKVGKQCDLTNRFERTNTLDDKFTHVERIKLKLFIWNWMADEIFYIPSPERFITGNRRCTTTTTWNWMLLFISSFFAQLCDSFGEKTTAHFTCIFCVSAESLE